jgi:hypothetical protein
MVEGRWRNGKACHFGGNGVGKAGKHDGIFGNDDGGTGTAAISSGSASERPGRPSESSGKAIAEPGSSVISSGTATDDGGRVKIDREGRQNGGKGCETSGRASIWPGTMSDGQKIIKKHQKPEFDHPRPLWVGKKRQRSGFDPDYKPVGLAYL